MSERCLIAEFASRDDARLGLEVLEKADFDSQQVSTVYRKEDHEIDELAEQGEGQGTPVTSEKETSEAPSGKSTGMGALLGGAVAGPLAVATMVGPFMLAGPIAGMAAGAAVGGVLGAADRWGATEEISEKYRRRVEAGSVLIIVNGDRITLDNAERSLRTTSVQNIERLGEKE